MITIVGIDCATQSRKTGLALGHLNDERTQINEVVAGSTPKALIETVTRWAQDAESVLLALDAPLGWPAPLGEALSQHQAGDPIATAPNDLFRRRTDRFVKQHVGQQPLDVGADRIARTAHAALSLLATLRQRLGQPISLAWAPISAGVYAIEVYPAATLKVYGFPYRRYKGRGREAQRRAMAAQLAERVDLSADRRMMEQNDDVLDAAICVLAGAEFQRGRAFPPEDLATAKREGWIWVPRPT